MSSINLNNVKKVHIIGIGGVGVSAIATMFLEQGKTVTGSDISSSRITEKLEQAGARINYGHKKDNLDSDTDLVVYTIAVNDENPEFAQARMLGIPMASYPEVLGLISKDKYTIAISGTHGKTTTTAMIAHILIGAGLDPTVIVGSLMKKVRADGQAEPTNFIHGASKYFVVEACEYRRSFLNLEPDILVVNNVDNDHLDYYHDMADIQSAFIALAKKLPIDGYLICDTHDPLLQPIINASVATVIDRVPAADIELIIPGAHNRTNAKTAYAVAQILGLPDATIRKYLKTFPGTWRRFEYKGKTPGGSLIYDDYAHHPTEITATIAAARELAPDRELIVIFQPHLYSRTKLLFNDFVKVLSKADRVLLAPIYKARETFDGSISSAQLAEALQTNGCRAQSFENFDDIADAIQVNGSGRTLIITMGAGDIYTIGDELVR